MSSICGVSQGVGEAWERLVAGLVSWECAQRTRGMFFQPPRLFPIAGVLPRTPCHYCQAQREVPAIVLYVLSEPFVMQSSVFSTSTFVTQHYYLMLSALPFSILPGNCYNGGKITSREVKKRPQDCADGNNKTRLEIFTGALLPLMEPTSHFSQHRL